MQVRHLVLAGILTWFIVALPHARQITPLWALCYVAFIVLFVLNTRDGSKGARVLIQAALQALLALVCIWLKPDGMQPVLLVIVVAQLRHLQFRAAMLWSIVQTASMYALVVNRTDHPGFMALGYFAFQLFGFMTARIAHEEREARQALAETNAELQVATALLDMSSRAEERLRIARDLHDLMGHHLTALSLNLEVASHLAQDQAPNLKLQIEKSQTIAKLLLSDVRDVVSRFRDAEPVDLAAALAALRESVPRPVIHVDADAAVAEPVVAQAALKAVQEIVTNAVRHSNARNLWLTVGTAQRTLAVDAKDDGGGTDRIVFGNGLRGMRERVQQAGGTLEVTSMRGHGFEVHVRIPLGGAA